VNRRSAPLGKSFHPNRPGKKQISGFGLPPIAVTKNQLDKKKCITPWPTYPLPKLDE